MLAIIEAVAMPPDDNGKQLIQLYSYQREDGAGTVRDAKGEDASPVAVIPVTLKRDREQCRALAKRICVILNKAESEVQ